MLNELTEEQKGFLNEIAYINIPENWGKVDNLADLVELSGREDLMDFIFDDKNKHLAQLVIKEYVNNNDENSKSGFCAIAFQDPVTGQIGMSFRGSENDHHEGQDWKKDMFDNFATALIGTSPQSAEAIAFYQRNKDSDGNNYLYGHSKGGELATSVYVLDYINIQGVHVINAQPINGMKLLPDQIAALQSSKFTALVVNGDIVAWLGARLYPVKFVVNNGKEGGFLGPHSIGNIAYDENGNAIVETKPFSGHFWQGVTAIFATGIVSTLQFKLRIPALAANIIVRISNFLIHDLPQLVKEFVEFSKRVIESIKEFTREVKEALKSFVSDLVSAVTSRFKQVFNSGYKYALSNPVIKLETYKLRNYADRLRKVNTRLNSLDSRINSLYWQVGFLDLLTLLQADLMTGESRKIKRCIAYLEETAQDFEEVEKKIMSQL